MNFKQFIKAAAAATSIAISASSFAAPPVKLLATCSASADVQQDAFACSGYREGNENQNVSWINTTLAGWGFDTPVAIPPFKTDSSPTDNFFFMTSSTGGTIHLPYAVSGDFVLSLFFGSGGGLPGSPNAAQMALYYFKNVIGATDIEYFTPSTSAGSLGGLSHSGLIGVPPIPEPETYALMLAGLGAITFVARRRKLSGR
jgi:hypothetical protein